MDSAAAAKAVKDKTDADDADRRWGLNLPQTIKAGKLPKPAPAKPAPRPGQSPKINPAPQKRVETASPKPVPGKEIAVDLGGDMRLELVLIPAGTFMMGDETNGPVHTVNITKPFYLGKYLVTQEQWQAMMGNNPSNFRGTKNPVEQVSWEDCRKFLEKLNVRVSGGKFSLPTEAQWEYACRAGSTTRYCFGDEESGLGEYAWYSGNSGNSTHPVGEKKPNAWGLYDMHGNVWEWCADWYDSGYYANSPVDNPTGAATGSDRVFRGGSWFITAGGCRSAFRYYLSPGSRSFDLGLRVSRAVEE
jgi:formylglycine-generating enzyme required for sulfatase activity